MPIIPRRDAESNRESTQQDLVAAVQDLSNNLASDSTLSTGLQELQDLLLQIDANVNDGVPMTPADLSALESITATILGMPTDFPDAATLAKLEQIRLLLLALPITPPQTDALTDTELRASAVPVTDSALGTATAPPTGTGLLGWLRGVYDRLADSSQITKISNGTNIADVVAGDAGYNGVVVVPTQKTITFTGISATTAAFPIDGYHFATVRMIANTGSFAMQGSNDTLNWAGLPIGPLNPTGPIQYSTGNTFNTSGGTFAVNTYGFKYLRITRSSGTATIEVVLRSDQLFPPGYQQINGLLTLPAVTQGAGANVSPWRVSGVAPQTTFNNASAAANGTACDVMAANSATMSIVATGTVSTINIDLQASMDGTNYQTISNLTSAAPITSTFLLAPVGHSWRFYRGKINSITGGGTIVAQICATV